MVKFVFFFWAAVAGGWALSETVPMNPQELQCAKTVKEKLSFFSNCGDRGTGVVKFCKRPAVHNGNYVCVARHAIDQSSECMVVIEMDKDCYRNIRATIVNDNREDI